MNRARQMRKPCSRAMGTTFINIRITVETTTTTTTTALLVPIEASNWCPFDASIQMTDDD